jgi:hypothetical protein
MFLARGDSLTSHAADYAPARWRRNVFGLRYPESIMLSTIDRRVTFRVTQRRSLDSSFFYLRFNGEATLAVNGHGEVLRAPLISEHFVPRPLRWRAVQWLINMRIGKGDRQSFLP